MGHAHAQIVRTLELAVNTENPMEIDRFFDKLQIFKNHCQNGRHISIFWSIFAVILVGCKEGEGDFWCGNNDFSRRPQFMT